MVRYCGQLMGRVSLQGLRSCCSLRVAASFRWPQEDCSLTSCCQDQLGCHCVVLLKNLLQRQRSQTGLPPCFQERVSRRQLARNPQASYPFRPQQFAVNHAVAKKICLTGAR